MHGAVAELYAGQGRGGGGGFCPTALEESLKLSLKS